MRKTLLLLACLAAPRALWACSVCFGQSDSPMAQGTNMGIFVMLGVTVAVLAAFAGFFIHLARRVRMFDEHEQAGRTGGFAQNVPNEGPAQC